MADGAQDAATSAAWLAAVATAAGAVIGAFGLYLANRLLGKAAFQAAINTGFVGLMERTERLHAQERRVWHDEMARLEARHAEERRDGHEQRLQLRGEIVNLKQTLAVLTNAARRAGVQGLPETEYPDPIITLEASDPP